MEPPVWKKCLGKMSRKWKIEYDDQKAQYDEEFKCVFQMFKGKNRVSKKDVMCRIIKELRKGKENKEVIVNSKTIPDIVSNFMNLKGYIPFYY